MINYDTILAGPELDALIAERALEFQVCWKPRPGYIQQTKFPFVLINLPTGIGPSENPCGLTWVECPLFSVHFTSAWRALEKIISWECWSVKLESDGERWCCTFSDDPLIAIYAYASTKELAICRAVLKVIEEIGR